MDIDLFSPKKGAQNPPEVIEEATNPDWNHLSIVCGGRPIHLPTAVIFIVGPAYTRLHASGLARAALGSLDDPVICGMRSDPKPYRSIVAFHGERSIADTHAHGP